MLDHQSAAAGELPGAHTTTPANFKSNVQAETQRMAKLIIRRSKDGQPTELSDLRAANFTSSQIGALFPEAQKRANRVVVRQDDLETALRQQAEDLSQKPLVSDERLLDIATDLATGLMPSEQQVFAALRRGGMQLDALDRLWPRIVERLGQHVSTGSMPKSLSPARTGMA